MYKFSKKFYFSYPCPRKLREVVKMSLVEREQPGKIKEIWQQYYNEKPNAMGMDISGEEMNLILKNANANPYFIFPVKKSTGYYNLITQNQDKSFIYTFLEDYKKNPNDATPYLVVTMFDELIFKKGKTKNFIFKNYLGVGLVRGDIIGDLSKKESEIIFNLTKKFYTNELYYNKVIQFNRESDKFNHQQHIDYCLMYFNNH